MEKIKKMIRIAASTTMSLIVFNIMLKIGMNLKVPYIANVWGLVLVLALGIIAHENIKIWNEKKPKVVNAE